MNFGKVGAMVALVAALVFWRRQKNADICPHCGADLTTGPHYRDCPMATGE